MSTLYESWTESGGDWTKSKIYLQVKQSERFKRVGVREWMTRAEMNVRFGPEGAAAIIDRKLSDKDLAKTETRRHPEAPDCDSLVQFLCLNQEKETDSTETTVNTLYEAAEAESSSSDSSNNDSNSSDTESSEVEKKKKIRERTQRRRRQRKLLARPGKRQKRRSFLEGGDMKGVPCMCLASVSPRQRVIHKDI